MDNSFLPQDYKLPSGSNQYMKWQDGENRFRILSDKPIIGWEDWDDEKHVYRYRMADKPSTSMSSKKGAKVKHFWAMVVWNVSEKKLQILNITQSSIQSAIKTLSQDEDWGNPRNYDIVVTKTGSDLDTEYQVTPKPARELDSEVVELYKASNINLEALFTNGDPFAPSEALNAKEDFNETIDNDDVPSIDVRARTWLTKVPQILKSVQSAEGKQYDKERKALVVQLEATKKGCAKYADIVSEVDQYLNELAGIHMDKANELFDSNKK